MKRLKKMMALVIAMVMVLAMGITVFAQTEGTAADGKGSITINNPAKGETYKVHKLFDATVDENGGIAYTATSIPEGLDEFFEIKNGYVYPKDAIAEKDDDGNITGTKMTDELKAALESWASDSNKTAEAVSNGDDDLVFQGLPYGYYVMTTTHKSDAAEGQEAKAAISVTSTKPNATINDKNVNEPSAKKEADKESYSVGDTVTYTATFDAPNYMEKAGGSDGESEQVVSYTIKDTLPDFLSNVAISSVKVKQPGVDTDATVSGITAFDENGEIVVPWVEENVPTADHKYTSKYKAGSQIIVTYTATLTSAANVGAANDNKVSIMPNVDRGKPEGPEPYQEEDEWNDTESITTHAAKLIKVDGADKTTPLKGAKFTFKGLTLTGSNGVYTVVSYDSSASAAAGTEVEVAEDGTLTIGGIDKAITLIGTETEAPKGYNKMTSTFEVPTVEMATTTTTTWGKRTVYYDADGNVVDEEVAGGSSKEVSEYATISDIPAASVVKVENNKGTELPSTGGIGTTIFYVIGAILVLGAGILLVTRRRMNAN